MILNKRQMAVLSELENTEDAITSKYLAQKFGVSLRTIRNDVDAIDEFIKGTGASFIRVHGVGMRIVSKNKLAKAYNNLENKNFAFYDEDERSLLIMLSLIFNDNPVTSSFLSERFEISQGTVLNEVKNTDSRIREFGLEIEGVKNKGFYLKGSNSDKAVYQYKMMKRFGVQRINKLLFRFENGYISPEQYAEVQSCMNYISNNLYLLVTDIYSLRYSLHYFFRCLNLDDSVADDKNIDNSTQLGKLVLYVQYQTGKHISAENIINLKTILNMFTDYNDDLSDQQMIEKGVDILIERMINRFPEIITEKDELHIDLVKHIKTSINNYNLNIESDNPLLDQIKTEYKKVFKSTKESLEGLYKYFSFNFDENEIGFITLYFCRTLDKVQQMSEAKIMVVCNTGRGASSFLARRIMNNCPTVHIVAMNSYVDLEKDNDILKNIDLIISTIPIPEVDKPVVTVSPLLTETELRQVKEAIFIGHNKHTQGLSSKDLNASVTRIVKTFTDYQNAKEFDDILFNANSQNKFYGMDTALFYSTIDIETSEMLIKLYPDGMSGEQMRNIAGLRLHLLMSVPRWLRRDFVRIGNLQDYKENYPKEYEAAGNLIHKLNDELKIEISDDEIGSIMQYLIM